MTESGASGGAGGEFSFSRFVEQSKRGAPGVDESVRYAYSADVAMLKGFRRVKPVELAAAATVRMYKDVLRNQLLGQTIKVGPTQFPRIHAIAQHCAKTLSVPVPTLYIANNPTVNAYTFGTDEDSFVVVHSALVDHFSEDELKFVIGHETGHIQNKHVVYNTVLHLLKTATGLFLPWIVMPAEIALSAWYRRAEITCDRAGLLCCGSVETGARTFLKMASGSQKLYQELNVEAYLEQLEEGREGPGRLAEAMASHPYLPKRVQALRVFSESALYKKAVGQPDGGLSMEAVDERTSEIIQIVKGKTEAKSDGGEGRS